MATPALESFCCMVHRYQNNTIKYTKSEVFDEDTMRAYNIACIVCGSLGIIGSCYQLYPRMPKSLPQSRRSLILYVRQNVIVCLLAVADLMASLGIVVRSTFWVSGIIPWKLYLPVVSAGDLAYEINLRYISCAVTSAWIHFFYICTYAWTACYAYDVYRLLSNKSSMLVLYHLLCWGVSGLLTAGGMISLYYPSVYQCVYDAVHLVPHYLSTYVPLLLVLILLPIVYRKSSQLAKSQVIFQCGRYTDQERAVVERLQRKFFSVNLVFLICWLPNVLNGLLLVRRHAIPKDIFIGLWIAMAVLNPLQGLLNCLVYRGAGGFNIHLKSLLTSKTIHPSLSTGEDSCDSEQEQLLSFRR